jgi:hypothetical protein
MILQWTQPTLIDSLSCQWTKITSLKITKIHLSEASVHAGRTVGVRCTVIGPMCCALSGHGAKYTPRPLMAYVRGPVVTTGRRGRSREIFPVSVIKYGPSSSPDGPPEPTASLPVKLELEGATGPK